MIVVVVAVDSINVIWEDGLCDTLVVLSCPRATDILDPEIPVTDKISEFIFKRSPVSKPDGLETVNVVSLDEKIGVTVRSAPDAGSEERGYGCNVEWLSLSQVNTSELSVIRTLSPLERPWLVVVSIVRIPEYAS